jgi:succinate dehydrogenase/fumarate reductase iron-sulfur protein
METSKIENRKIKVKVSRFDPKKDNEPYLQSYQVPVPIEWKMSVLSILQYIFENLDPSLGFTGSCEKGLCGVCTVIVNGKTRLACNTFVNSDVTIEPIKGMKIIKDLVVDRYKNVK